MFSAASKPSSPNAQVAATETTTMSQRIGFAFLSAGAA
jgi:hypothetical protein